MEENTLPHLRGIPKYITKYNVSYYTVALEAWRRGLKVTFHNYNRGSSSMNRSHQYTISDEHNAYHFLCARGSHTTQKAIDITENKHKAYEYFKKANVPTPEGKAFNFRQTPMDEIIEYALSIGYPLVVKATSLQGGKGVYTHITNLDQLKESLLKVRDTYNSENVMVEKYISGIDYRFFVMKDKVLAASKSYSSFVVGDGKHNIEELIAIMNKKIKNSRFHAGRTLKVDDDMLSYLNEQNLSLDSVPEKGKRIFLRRHGTYLSMRLNVDCTDTIDPKFKEYAVKAIQSIEGIPYGSVDMIIDEEKNEGVVNEINTSGEIAMHITPIEGKPRDIPKAIIDYYFPNTERLSDTMYFEMKPIKDVILAGLAQDITVPVIPKEKVYHQQFEITGKNLGPVYLRKIYRRAARYQLMGTIYKTDKNTISIDLYGTETNLNRYNRFLKKAKTKISVLEKLHASDLVENTNQTHPVHLELKDLHNPSAKLNLKYPN